MTNPAITRNAFCVLAMRSERGNFSEGFDVIGPFPTSLAAVEWAETNIVNTPHDNPHWVVERMTVGVGHE